MIAKILLMIGVAAVITSVVLFFVHRRKALTELRRLRVVLRDPNSAPLARQIYVRGTSLLEFYVISPHSFGYRSIVDFHSDAVEVLVLHLDSLKGKAQELTKTMATPGHNDDEKIRLMSENGLLTGEIMKCEREFSQLVLLVPQSPTDCCDTPPEASHSLRGVV